MKKGDFTLNDWLAFTEGDPQQNLSFRVMLSESADQLLQCVEDALNLINEKMVANRQYRQGLSEDQLTIQIAEALGYFGLLAKHDAMVGGHCDISIEMRHSFLWLAEAKIWKGCAWAFKGFRQLLTRYATGLPGQCHGALLIYSFRPDAATSLAKWRTFLNRRRILQLEIGEIADLRFSSSHTHPGSGLQYEITHRIIPLYWNPTDT